MSAHTIDKTHDEDRGFWLQSLDILKIIRLKAGFISFFGIFLPQILFGFGLGFDLNENVQRVRKFAEISAPSKDLLSLMDPIQNMLWSVGVVGFGGVLVALFSYFCLLELTVAAFRGQNGQGLWTRAGRVAWLFARSGLVICIVTLLIFGTLQALFPVLIVIAFPVLIAPVIATAERKGVFASIYGAFSFNYTAPAVRSETLRLFFHLAGFGLTFYLLLLLAAGFGFFLQDLDVWVGVSRKWFHLTYFGYLTPAYIFATLVKSVAMSFVVVLLAVSSTTLYMRLKGSSHLNFYV